MKTERLNERLLARWLRNCFKIKQLWLIGGGNFCNLASRISSRLLAFPVLLVLCLLGTALFVSSCEKEVLYEGFPEMHDYYVESCGLGDDAVDMDSIGRFSQKVDHFVAANPEAEETSYYPLIKANIKKYSVGITIILENEGRWAGETEHRW